MMRFTSTLRGQLIALLIGIMLVSQILVMLVFYMKTEDRIDAFEEVIIVKNIANTLKKIGPMGEREREELLTLISTFDLFFFLSNEPVGIHPIDDFDLQQAFAAELGGKPVLFRRSEGSLNFIWDFWFSDDWRGCIQIPRPKEMMESCPQRVLSIRVDDSVWLNASAEHEPSEFIVLFPNLLSMFLTLAGVIFVTVFAVKRITKPLQELSVAAEKFGRGEQIGRLEIQGPKELSSLTNTFNEMQEQITRYIKDRTHMLGAISHDLRTPITALRIRAEFIENTDLQSKMIKILEDMEKMVGSTLDFARQEDSQSYADQIDLVATLKDICEEFDDVAYVGEKTRCEVLCHELSIKRAIRNLIDNAVKYGDRASVDLETVKDEVLVKVRDSGPGVPEESLEKIFEPFVRLDESRNTESGNVGLGLSIARTIVHKLGGRIWARNAAVGLEVVVALPPHAEV